MKKIAQELITARPEERNSLILDFLGRFWAEALYTEKFYWAMSDEQKALRLHGHQEIGWFNSKTEEFVATHQDAYAILVERIAWSSSNPKKVSFDVKWPTNNHQLLCVEMKLKTEESAFEKNFYLKIGMIPVWSEDYSEIVDYLDEPVVDFHD